MPSAQSQAKLMSILLLGQSGFATSLWLRTFALWRIDVFIRELLIGEVLGEFPEQLDLYEYYGELFL